MRSIGALSGWYNGALGLAPEVHVPVCVILLAPAVLQAVAGAVVVAAGYVYAISRPGVGAPAHESLNNGVVVAAAMRRTPPGALPCVGSTWARSTVFIRAEQLLCTHSTQEQQEVPEHRCYSMYVLSGRYNGLQVYSFILPSL